MKIYTKGINEAGLIGIVCAIVVIIVGAWWWRSGGITATPLVQSDRGRTPAIVEDTAVTTTTIDEFEVGVSIGPGTYQEYSQDSIAVLPETSMIVLFFSSSGCQSCLQAEAALVRDIEQIPTNVHIFRVDYDSQLSIRRQWGVTSPHTFVEINTDGQFVQRWSSSRDLNSILARLR